MAHTRQHSGTSPVTPIIRSVTHGTDPTNRAPSNDSYSNCARSPPPPTSLILKKTNQPYNRVYR